jgi:prephenate dehydrogenase
MLQRLATSASVPPRTRLRPSLGLIGLGAFGSFCLPHLAPFFALRLHDAGRDLALVAARHGAVIADLAAAAACDIVVLAVPLDALADVARRIAPHLAPGALVIDVCSLKLAPLAILRDALPGHVEIIGTHPLFGPQSGRDGVAGQRIAVCGAGSSRQRALVHFLRYRLGLAVIETVPEEHDRQVAYVQGLTHILARAILAMDLPPLTLTTTTFDHLMRMVDTVRHDSDQLFRAIVADNPFTGEVKEKLLSALAATGTGAQHSGSTAFCGPSFEISRPNCKA